MSATPKKRKSSVTIPVQRVSLLSEPVERRTETRAEQIQAENPTWSWGTCLASAKLERNK